MRTSLTHFIRRYAAIAGLAIVLPVAACDDGSEPLAPGIPVEQEQRQAAGTVITYPASALADFPISMHLGGRAVEGASVEWAFSDGTRQRGARVTKSFADSGLTTVNVRVTEESGRSYGITRVIEVGPSIASLATMLTGINPGGLHSCAIDSTQSLFCWGYNGNGNVGDGTTASRISPVLVGGTGNFAQVATGHAHSCALTTAGAAFCWGRNNSGELGDGTQTDRFVPTAVLGGLTFTSIDVGYNHSCGITANGVAYCWGGNSVGQLGNGGAAASSVPVAVTGGLSFSMVRAGYYHSCAIQSVTGLAFCWGSNWMGQTGANSTADFLAAPTAVSGGYVFTQLDAGGYHACGTTATRTYCWGWNGYGQLGATSNATCGTAQPCARMPVRLNSSLRFNGVSVGINHSCAIEPTGDIHCWGSNSNGQIGDGTTTNQQNAKRVQVGTGFKSILTGGSFTCGVSLDNRAYCWGSNELGKLGLGDTVDRHSPALVPNLIF